MQRRQSQLTVGFSSTFKRQLTWDSPLASGEINMAHPATSTDRAANRNYVETEETVEEVYDCTGEDFLIERVTGRFSRITLEFEADPHLLAGWGAFAYGVAASPSGGVSAVQTIDASGGAAGSIQLRFTNNYNMQLSGAIAIGANAAAIQAILDAMPNIGAGQSVVSGGPFGTAPVVVTFSGTLADTPLPDFEVLSALTTGTASAVTTTPGVGRTHQINRLAAGLYTLPYTTLYIGFRGSNRDPLICPNCTVTSFRCRGTSREVVTVTVTLIMRTPTAHATGFILPACMDIEPIRFSDCDAILEGESLFAVNGPRWGNGSGIAPWRDFEYGFDNNIGTGPAAFTSQAIDIGRTERADRRVSYVNLGLFGEEGDPLWVAARQEEPRYITSLDLRLGPVSRNALFKIPQGVFKLDSPNPIRFEGEFNESTLRTIMRPKKVQGNSATPSNIIATTPQVPAYLVGA